MKKLSILFLSTFLVLSSCSKDDGPLQIDGNIVGTWNMVDYDYSGQTSTTFDGQTINTNFVAEAFNMDYQLVFSEDPKTYTSSGSFDVRLTTTINGQTQTQTTSIDDVFGTGTWDIDGSTISFDPSDMEASSGTIVALNDTTLILSVKEEEDFSQSGATIKTTLEARITFERVE